MKKFITTTIILAMVASFTTLRAQTHNEEYLGLPGDNLNLYAVMKLFQESETLEGFERNLNDENSRINNLDLNGDNYVDYINVTDYVDGDVHNIVLQVPINNKEIQDVAVFTVQRFSNDQVQIQLIGDEELYGRNYIIEPFFDDQIAGQTPNPGYTGNNITVVRTTTYEIAAWPVIRFIFRPGYIVWRSSWHWGYYPSYWHHWQPYYWDFYYGYHYNWYHNYYSHYRRWKAPRYDRWNDFYYSSRRSHSPTVSVRINSGNYKSTYSHPDQRKKGEALYNKTNKNQSSRRADQSPGNNSVRRSGTQSDQSRQTNGTGNSTTSTRRISNSTKNGSSTSPASGQNTGSSRRSSSKVTSKSSSNPPTGTNASSSRKSEKSTTPVAKSSSRRSSKTSKAATPAKKSDKKDDSKTTKAPRKK